MGETPDNQASSRSHAIFTLGVSSERKERHADAVKLGEDGTETGTVVTQSELSLIDLAGSERMYKNDRHG